VFPGDLKEANVTNPSHREHARARRVATLLCLIALAVPARALTPAGFGDGGFSPSDMDKTAVACKDFYQYAVGGWLKANPIPADYPSWGAFNELNERNREALHRILERLGRSQSPEGSDERKLGDFYSSCMDETAIEAQGARPLAGELKRIAAIQDLPALEAEIARLQTYGVAAGFQYGSEPDRKDSAHVIAAAFQGGLGLPERDYYTKTDKESKDLRAKYVAHVAKTFDLLGDPPETPEARRRR
jgi:putative endopeptidase